MGSQSHLPPGSGDFPAFTPAEDGTRFNDPRGMQGSVDLGGGYIQDSLLVSAICIALPYKVQHWTNYLLDYLVHYPEVLDNLQDKTKRLLSLHNLCKLGLILKFGLIQKDYLFYEVTHCLMWNRLRYFTSFIIVLCSTLIWYNWGLISPVVQRCIYFYYYDMPVPV